MACHKLSHKIKKEVEKAYIVFEAFSKLKSTCFFSRGCSNRQNSLFELFDHQLLLFEMDRGVEEGSTLGVTSSPGGSTSY